MSQTHTFLQVSLKIIPLIQRTSAKICIIQMQADKFERILGGQTLPLSQSELMQFQGYCSARNYSLDQLIAASVTLYKVNPELSYSFLSYLDRHELSKPIYNDYQHQNAKITIYNNLTGLVLAKATRENSKDEVNRFLGEAKKFLNSSQKVRMTVDKSIILNRAFLHYYAGQVTKALNLVSRIYEQIQKTGEGKGVLVTATLMLAQIHFTKKNYQKSLDLYKKCLEINKALPVKARIGMAYCFFYLGKYEMARACFQRILKLDATCVQAYIGIAVVYEKEDIPAHYFKYVSLAYKLNKRHPLVLLHLAQNFLFRKDLQKTNYYCQKGLQALQRYPKFITIEEFCRNDYEELKARFNNLIAQTHHINSNFIDAIKYYSLAAGKGLLYNEIHLAQAYINPNSQNYIEAIKLLEDNYKLTQGKDNRLVNDTYKLMAYLKSKVPPKAKDEKGPEFYYNQALRFNRYDFDARIEYATNILVQTSKSRALKMLQQAQKNQLISGNQIKPELENNIAVLYLQNGQIEACQKRLDKCLATIEALPATTEEQQARKMSLKIVAKFNYGICMQKQSKWDSATVTYTQILSINKYHIDSAMRLAYAWNQLGSYMKTYDIFQNVRELCEENKKILKQERFAHAKAFIEHISGSSIDARQTLKKLGKHRDIYSQIFEMCIAYESTMRKGVELNVLKDFLRPNRQFCYKLCRDDPHAAFAYMLLAIILLVDKKITKAQGIQFFNNLKQFMSQELPSIYYNMGLFLMYYDDYENSNLILNLYKDKVGVNSKTEQLIALNYILQSNLEKAESIAKRNILRQPCNYKFKLQLCYILQRKSLMYYERQKYTTSQIDKRKKQLDYTNTLHDFISKLNHSQISKTTECIQLKQRIKILISKIKNCVQERRLYTKSYADSFDKIKANLAAEQARKLAQVIMSNDDNVQDHSRELQLQQILNQAEQSEDEQQREKKQLALKKQRALEIARKRQAQMDNVWNQLKQKAQQQKEEKKNKKRGPREVKSTAGRKKERPKEKDSLQYDEEAREMDQGQEDAVSYKESQSEEQEAQFDEESQKSERREKKHKKHKKQKHKKNKHKHRKEQDQQGNGDRQPQAKSEKKKSDNNDDNEQLMKYLI